MNKIVAKENFLQSMAMQCQMPVIIHHDSMVPIHIFSDDAAGVPHQMSFLCRPNHIDQVVKSLRRLTPVALPKRNEDGVIIIDPALKGTELNGPEMVRLERQTAVQNAEESSVEYVPSEAEIALAAREENNILRELLALRHGCPGPLYLDDGEMQCHECRIDFRRDPIEKIIDVFERQVQEAMEKYREETNAARTGISVDQAPGDSGDAENKQTYEAGAGLFDKPPVPLSDPARDNADHP